MADAHGAPVSNVQRLHQQPVFPAAAGPTSGEEALPEVWVIPRPEHLVRLIHALHLFPEHAQALQQMTQAAERSVTACFDNPSGCQAACAKACPACSVWFAQHDRHCEV